TMGHTTFYRILPVNIEAIKDSRCMDAWGEISFDKSVHAGAHKFTHVLGSSGAGKTLRLAPAAERYNHLQFGITAFQLLKLMEGAAEPIGSNGVGCAIHALGSRISMNQSCLAVCNLASIAVNPAKCIVEPGKQGRSAAGYNIFDGVPARFHAAFGKVPDHLGVNGSGLGLSRLRGQSKKPRGVCNSQERPTGLLTNIASARGHNFTIITACRLDSQFIVYLT